MLQAITYEILRNRQHTRIAKFQLLSVNCVEYRYFRTIVFVTDTSEH